MPYKPHVNRIHSRFACDLPVQIYSPTSQDKLADARLIDVGMGGGNVSSDLHLKRSIPYEFRFQWGKETLAVLGQIIWSSPTDKKHQRFNRYGVSFSLSTSQEALMQSLIDSVAAPQ